MSGSRAWTQLVLTAQLLLRALMLLRQQPSLSTSTADSITAAAPAAVSRPLGQTKKPLLLLPVMPPRPLAPSASALTAPSMLLVVPQLAVTSLNWARRDTPAASGRDAASKAEPIFSHQLLLLLLLGSFWWCLCLWLPCWRPLLRGACGYGVRPPLCIENVTIMMASSYSSTTTRQQQHNSRHSCT